MTLGEFRHITAKLPDDTEFVGAGETEVEYSVRIKTEYYRVRKDGKMVPIEETIELLQIPKPRHD